MPHDAIVEVENIIRHLRMGKTPYQAAMEAADEIGMAVIATTFTLIAVFFSLVVARLLTPMMAAYFLKAPRKAHAEPFWMTFYLRWAAWCLQHRAITTLAAGRDSFSVPSPWSRCCRPDSCRRMTCRKRRCTSRCRRAAPSGKRWRLPSRRAKSCKRTRM